MKSGAVEFLTKPFEVRKLLGAVQQALASDTARRRVETEEAGLRARYEMLTRREREVMGLVVSGLLNKQYCLGAWDQRNHRKGSSSPGHA